MKQLAVALLIISVVCSCPPAVSAGTSDDIVIIVDQSASMQEYTPRFVAGLWISAFLQTFTGGHNINLAGFSEDVTEHIRLELRNESDLNKLREYMQKIPASGLITDFEPPLEYLLKYPREIGLVVFITDGKPDIWDEKNVHLSRKIRMDKRYSGLNSIYASSRSQGTPGRELLESLKARYEARNNELVDGHLTGLRKKFGGKIVFLDVSGKHGYLPVMAEKINAHYVKTVIEAGENSEEEVKKALAELLIIAGKVLRPGEEEAAALKARLEKSARERAAAARRERDLEKWLYVGVLLVLIIAVGACLLWRIRKKAAAAPVDDAAQLEPAVAAVTEPQEEEYSPDFALLDDRGYIATVKKKYQAMASTSLEAARRYIEKEILIADKRGNLEKLRLLRQMLEEVQFDRRFSLRVPVPPGTMHVIWKDPSGNTRKSPVIDISFSSLLFEEPDFTAGKIDAIECLPLDMKMDVKNSVLETRENRLHVVILEDFDDNVRDRMHWIEMLTRIEEVR